MASRGRVAGTVVMLTILGFLLLAAVAYWAGFRAPPHGRQYLSRIGFVVFLTAAALLAGAERRERVRLRELAALFPPVPGVTDVTLVPRGSPPSPLRTWVLTTRLTADQVVAFYSVSSVKGWALEARNPPTLVFAREQARMTVTAFDDAPRAGSLVSYEYSETPGNRRP